MTRFINMSASIEYILPRITKFLYDKDDLLNLTLLSKESRKILLSTSLTTLKIPKNHKIKSWLKLFSKPQKLIIFKEHLDDLYDLDFSSTESLFMITTDDDYDGDVNVFYSDYVHNLFYDSVTNFEFLSTIFPQLKCLTSLDRIYWPPINCVFPYLKKLEVVMIPDEKNLNRFTEVNIHDFAPNLDSLIIWSEADLKDDHHNYLTFNIKLEKDMKLLKIDGNVILDVKNIKNFIIGAYFMELHGDFIGEMYVKFLKCGIMDVNTVEKIVFYEYTNLEMKRGLLKNILWRSMTY